MFIVTHWCTFWTLIWRICNSRTRTRTGYKDAALKKQLPEDVTGLSASISFSPSWPLLVLLNGDDTFRMAPPVAVPNVRTTEVVAEVTFFVTDPTFFVTEPTFFVTLLAVRFAIFFEDPARPDANCFTAFDPSEMVNNKVYYFNQNYKVLSTFLFPLPTLFISLSLSLSLICILKT